MNHPPARAFVHAAPLEVAEIAKAEPGVRDYLIRKGGYYYRANRSGYTTEALAAGRYTEAEARAEAKIEPWHMAAVHISEVITDADRVSINQDLLEIFGRNGAEVVQLERQLSKLVRAAENFAQHRDHDGMRQSLFDAISTAKAHLS